MQLAFAHYVWRTDVKRKQLPNKSTNYSHKRLMSLDKSGCPARYLQMAKEKWWRAQWPSKRKLQSRIPMQPWKPQGPASTELLKRWWVQPHYHKIQLIVNNIVGRCQRCQIYAWICICLCPCVSSSPCAIYGWGVKAARRGRYPAGLYCGCIDIFT